MVVTRCTISGAIFWPILYVFSFLLDLQSNENYFNFKNFTDTTIDRQHFKINNCLEAEMEDYLNCHYCYICTLIKDSSDNFRFGMCFVFHVRFFFFVIVKIELFVPLLCACALPGKAIPEMTFTVSGGTLNPIHSLTHFICCCYSSCCCQCSSNCHFAATGGRTTTRRLIRVAMTAGLLFSQALVL